MKPRFRIIWRRFEDFRKTHIVGHSFEPLNKEANDLSNKLPQLWL